MRPKIRPPGGFDAVDVRIGPTISSKTARAAIQRAPRTGGIPPTPFQGGIGIEVETNMHRLDRLAGFWTSASWDRHLHPDWGLRSPRKSATARLAARSIQRC